MRYTTRIIVPPRIRRSGPPGSPGGAYGPQTLGVRKTLGFGDLLGLAAPAHVAVASRHPEFAPVLVQLSSEQAAAFGQTFSEGVGNVARAVSAARFRQPWGADADRLRTAQEVLDAAEAGFTYFTLDPSEFYRVGVQDLSPTELSAAIDAMIASGELPENWSEPYLNRTIDLPGNHRLQIDLEPLQRAALRYANGIQHCARLASAVARSSQGRPFEIEVALDATDVPASPLDQLFVGLELEARGVRLTSLALRYEEEAFTSPHGAVGVGGLEKTLREHAAVADFCGPYKLCFHDVDEDSPVFPFLAQACGNAFHLKVSTVSYLEALRVVAEVDPDLFREIAMHGSGQEADASVLDDPTGRRRLNSAASALMSGQTHAGQSFKQVITELLGQHAELYSERLGRRYARLIERLTGDQVGRF